MGQIRRYGNAISSDFFDTKRKTNGQAAPASVYALDQVPDRASTEEVPHL